jgi:signal transduction histidine kinase
MADLQAEVRAVARIAAVPTILDVVCRTTGLGFAVVTRVTEERWIACSLKDEIGFGLHAGSELAVESTICHEIRQHRHPVVIDNVACDATYRDHHTPALYGFQSYISVPVVLPDGVFFGTLCALDRQPHMVNTPEIVASFTLFAELIAYHLDADRRVREAAAMLAREREIAELREQFIAVLGHDLRNPLQAVSAAADLLAADPMRAAEMAGHIQQSVGRMIGLIDNVTDFARGRLGGGLSLVRDAEGPVEAVLRQVVQELRTTHPDRVIALDLDLVQPVACDRPRIAQLLSNLLGNALTHGDPAAPVQVRASARDGAFVLDVINSGEPIPPETLHNLFQPFFRGTTPGGAQGLGLGLYIASEIARAHEGTIEVVSTAEETRFRFRMGGG